MDSKMHVAIFSGIVTGDAMLVTVPEVIAKVKSAQLFLRWRMEHYFCRKQMLNFQNPTFLELHKSLFIRASLFSFAQSILCDLPFLFSLELKCHICQASVLPRCSDSLSLSLAKSSKIRSSSSCLSGPLRQKKMIPH